MTTHAENLAEWNIRPTRGRGRNARPRGLRADLHIYVGAEVAIVNDAAGTAHRKMPVAELGDYLTSLADEARQRYERMEDAKR